MNYASNEDFFGISYPNTGPIMSISAHESQQDISDTQNGDVALPRLSTEARSQDTHNEHPTSQFQSLQELFVDLESTREERRLEALRVLRDAGAEACLGAMPEIQRALKDDSESIRGAAVEVLAILNDVRSLKLLMTALTDTFWEIRATAAQALGNRGTQTPIHYLTEVFEIEQDESVREAIAQALGKQGRTMPMRLMLDILRNDPDWLVRSAAARALGELRQEAPVHALIHTLQNDPDECVRATAAWALGQSWMLLAEGPLFKALQDDGDEDVQEAAALALQQLDEETRGLTAKYDDDLADERSSSVSSTLWKQTQKEQLFFALAEFMGDKRGGVWKRNVTHTQQGQVLRIDCFYQSAGKTFYELLHTFLEEKAMIQPIEAALNERDDMLRAAVTQAFHAREKRPWLDLLIVSIALSGPPGEKVSGQMPLRVILSGMSCKKVRENDTSVLDQIMDTWTDAAEQQPLIRQQSHDLTDIKIWYQSASEHPSHQFASL